MYESETVKALKFRASRSFPLGQRAFQVLGRHGSFSKTSAVDHRKQKLISEAKTRRTQHVNK